MKAHRRNKLLFVIVLIVACAIAAGLALYALKQNINLYSTPSQVLKQHIKVGQEFRLGGLVVKGSVKRGKGLEVQFTLTDYYHNMIVRYNGILPCLFREGQGIVAQGKMNAQHIFIADQVLAKHSATYRPPGIPKNRPKQPTLIK